MWRLTPDELNEILRKHFNWLNGEGDRECADLRRADLRHRSLAHANLRGANLCCTNLIGADLRYADLSCTNMRGADLSAADLTGACLGDAELTGADMRYTNLCAADLRNANLCNVNMNGANIHCASMSCAKNIDSVMWDECTAFYPLQCPESGSFIGYKQAQNLIIKLEICEDALRSSATSRKCRCSKAKVLGFEDFDGKSIKDISWVSSDYDPGFIYAIGKIVEVPNFDTDRWNECTRGIHFFLTREEAVKYLG